jgi:ATP-dependent helicase YprA (DUF1998 family)
MHFAVIDTTNNRNIVLEEVEASRAFFTIYEGGIFPESWVAVVEAEWIFGETRWG